VIEGAFRVLDEFEAVEGHTEAMKALQLQPPEEIAFATAALALRFGERGVERHGFYLIQCPEDQVAGAPHPARWIDPLMRPQGIDRPSCMSGSYL